MRLTGKVALVAGVGKGMGRATAELFAVEGAAVVIAARHPEVLAATAAAIVERGGRVQTLCADLTVEAGAAAAVAAAQTAFGGLDILVNNAGGFFQPALGLDALAPEHWDAALSNLLRGMALVTRAALPAFVARGGGCILNVSASLPTLLKGNPAYAAGKAGAIGLTRSLARSLHGQNVRVNCIAPGLIRLSNPGPGLPPGGLDRFGSPLDVAHAALYLVSDEARWVTGQVLAVDGGDEALTFTVAERNELGLKP